MNNFELIDDYLTNRLRDAKKVEFEEQLASDPALKADVLLQKQILEGVKKARATELKAMLQKVPVGGGSTSFNFPMLRIAAGVVGAGLMIAALSFYFKNGKEVPNMSSSIEDSIKKTDPKDFEPLEEPALAPSNENEEEKSTKSLDKKQSNAKQEITKPSEQVKPKIEAVDPSNEMIDNTEKTPVSKETNKSGITASHIAVDVDSANKKYSFHYQFIKGKLMLYGTFDKALYEILEINGENHAVFMFYKDSYYLLNERQSSIALLEPIKDKLLLSKLNEYKAR